MVTIMLVPLAETETTVIGPIEFQNQRAQLIRSLTFSQVDGRPHPVSGSMGTIAPQFLKD